VHTNIRFIMCSVWKKWKSSLRAVGAWFCHVLPLSSHLTPFMSVIKEWWYYCICCPLRSAQRNKTSHHQAVKAPHKNRDWWDGTIEKTRGEKAAADSWCYSLCRALSPVTKPTYFYPRSSIALVVANWKFQFKHAGKITRALETQYSPASGEEKQKFSGADN
jgi:hypothetical protein